MSPSPPSLTELKANSGLPGPRGNLALLDRFVKSCTPEAVAQCLGELRDDTSNSPEEFVGMCGVVGFAVLHAHERELLVDHLRTYALHSSWRIREAVAIALQELPVATLEDRLAVTEALENGHPLVARALVAGLCEPRNLKGQTGAPRLFGHLMRATQLLYGKGRLTPEEQVLKKGLGYCWSVALSEFYEQGWALFEGLPRQEPHVGWVVAENLKKKRLVQKRGSITP